MKYSFGDRVRTVLGPGVVRWVGITMRTTNELDGTDEEHEAIGIMLDERPAKMEHAFTTSGGQPIDIFLVKDIAPELVS